MHASEASRKRRKVDKASAVAPAAKKASAGGLYLDDDAVRRSMLAMMQAKDSAASEDKQEHEEDASSEASNSEEDEEASDASVEDRDPAVVSDDSEDDEPQASRAAPASSAPSRISKADLAADRKPGNKAQPLPNTFEAMGVLPTLINTLASISIHRPTEIQSACIGPILQGRDCIGGAKTGSGKTMAFALPILQRIHRDPFGIFSVVLTPTRELAFQLAEQFLVLGKPLGLTISTVVGGMDMMQQARELCGRPHVVVATPGRLCDLLKSGGGAEWDLKRVKVLVLDEADRLLSSSFAPELQYLFGEMPADRQTLLFTATISPTIEALADRPPRPGKQRPFVHRVEAESLTVATLRQLYMFIPSQVRDPYLYHLLLHPPQAIAHLAPKYREDEAQTGRKRKKGARGDDAAEDVDDALANIPSTIIFTQRCATAQLVHLILTELGIPSVSLHSHLSQPQRLLSLARFRAGSVPVLVTTDVGSRGLDIPEVSLVVNWDCPRVPENYVHRVGRTARAGRGGVAVTIVTERDVELIQGIEKAINVKLTELELPEETVLNKLNQVSTARRVATMAMHDSGFGERQKVNKAKALSRQKRDAAAAAGA